MNTSWRRSRLAFALNLVGAIVVGYSLVRAHGEHRPAWVLAVALASVVLWVLRSFFAVVIDRPRLDLLLCALTAATGSLVSAPTDGLSAVPAAVAILVAIGSSAQRALAGAVLALGSIVLIAVGAAWFGTPVPALLGMLGGVTLAAFAGLSRRQYRRSDEQAALLRERELEMRQEAARVAIARDLHDVLAHSLGGLVIQLDAADALLEAGDTEAARSRVVDARGLAAEGLAEARRAVAALRDPAAADASGPVAPEALAASLADLVAAHRSLGGSAELAVRGEPRELSAAQAAAVQRALQEALSNARKHAPGEPVRGELDWQNDRVRLTVSNPLPPSGPAALAATGGRHGIEGMRERFVALPLGGSASAGVDGGRFTVTAEARLA